MKYALRQLLHAPVFLLTAVLTLALGIGVNTAMFSVMDAVLMRGLPVPNPQQVYRVLTTTLPDGQTGNGNLSLEYPEYAALRARTDVFQSLVAYVPLGISPVAVRFGSEPTTASGDMVSGNYFSGLGVRIARGRGLTPADESQHAAVVVLSDAYWRKQFAANPGVIGKTLYVNGVPCEIRGIAASGFAGTEYGGTATEFWIPFQNRPELRPWGMPDRTIYSDPHWSFLMMDARLRAGVTPKQAEAALDPVFTRTAYQGLAMPGPHEQVAQLDLQPARGIYGADDVAQPLYALMGMVGLVLLIACTNVAMLIIAKNAARQREFSLRLALGGGRARLFRQLLGESLLLVALGTGLGWIFAVWSTRALAAWAQITLALVPDNNVLAVTFGVAALAAIAFGLAPLRSATRVPLAMALKAAGGSYGQGRNKMRGQQAVTVFQVALSLALLVCGGVLVHSLRNLENVPLGMHARSALVFGITPRTHTASETGAFYQQLLQGLRSVPGIEGVSLAENRPGSGWSNNNDAKVDGVTPQGNNMVRSNDVGPDFFHVMGTPILQGRDFSDNDTAAAPKVAIVNQTFVKRFLRGGPALGHKLYTATIVGVVADSKYTSVDEKAMPMAWFPYTQTGAAGTENIELRAKGAAPDAMWPAVRSAVRQVAPELPLVDPMTQRAQFDQSLENQRILARLAMFFGLLAALLVATGLYGTLAYKVVRRTGEIGVRMALGARPAQVLGMIVRESLLLAAIGIGFGLPLAYAGAAVVRSALYGVGRFDAATFSAAMAGLVMIAIAASLIPARRAAAVDPLLALRAE